MRRLAGLLAATVVVLGVVTGCGADDGAGDTSADDPAATVAPATVAATETPATESPAAGSLAFTEVELVSQTGATSGSGTGTGVATVLDGPAAIGPFADQFQQGPLTGELMMSIDSAEVPEGQVLLAAVVGVGCDVPPGVASVTERGGDLVVTAQPVAQPMEECFAPVTTVALVLVEASVVASR